MNLRLDEKGQALVELALSLLLLMLIVFGITEFGRALYVKNTLTNAAREGARRAAVSTTTADIDSYVRSRFPAGYDQAGLIVTPTKPAADTVKVTVTQPFNSLVPLITQLCSLTLTGEATMRYEL